MMKHCFSPFWCVLPREVIGVHAPFPFNVRSILFFHADDGVAEKSTLPPECAMLGGRSLAEVLSSRVPCGPALILAPGLLSSCRRVPASRCCVACRPGERSPWAFASVGGSSAHVLSDMGIAALVLYGVSQGSQLQDLAAGADGVRCYPSLLAGTSVSAALSCLRSARPHADAFIVAGPAGELDLPMASLAFGSKKGHAVSRAGGGAGQALWRMGIKALLLDAPKNASESVQSPAWEEDFMRFFAGPSSQLSRCTGCTPQCSLRSKDLDESGVSSGKWPGYAQGWSCGNRDLDRENMRRYAIFCNEFGVDAFALAGLLDEAREKGLLTAKTAYQLLDDLDRLLDRPESSPLLGLLREQPCPLRKGDCDPWKYFLDSLGLCGFAAAALDTEDKRAAFIRLAADTLGLDTAALAAPLGSMMH